MKGRIIRQGREQAWTLRYYVPKAWQPLIGKAEVRRSLRTADRRAAERRAAIVEAEIVRELRARMTATADPLQGLHDLAGEVAAGKVGADQFELAADAVAERIEAAATAAGYRPVAAESGEPMDAVSVAMHADPRIRMQVEAVRLAHERAGGTPVCTLREAVRDYLADRARTAQPATVHGYRVELDRLIEFAGPLLDVRRLTDGLAARYVTERMLTREAAPRTIRERISWLSSFGRWLRLARLVPANPFEGQALRVPRGHHGKARAADAALIAEGEKRPWSPAELVTLLHGLHPRERAAFTISLHSGMRLEEIARLERGDLRESGGVQYVTIREGKTRAALRRVPLHPMIAGMVQGLAAATPDGWLFPGLAEVGLRNRRGHRIGGDFARHRADLLPGARGADFHSARRNAITAALHGGANLGDLQAVVGHELSEGGQTRGRAGYERPADIAIERLRRAVLCIEYPPEVTAAAREAVAIDTQEVPRSSPKRRRSA